MRKVNQHPTAVTVAILLSALVLGFVVALLTVQTSSPEQSADEVLDGDLVLLSSTLGTQETNFTPAIACNPAGEDHSVIST